MGNKTRNTQSFSLLGGRNGTGLANASTTWENEALKASWSQQGDINPKRGAESLRRHLGASRLGRRRCRRLTEVAGLQAEGLCFTTIARMSGDPPLAEQDTQGQLHVNHKLPSVCTVQRAPSLPLSGHRGPVSAAHTRLPPHNRSSSFTHSSSSSGRCPGRPAGARSPGWG